jgi:hypothetical protein
MKQKESNRSAKIISVLRSMNDTAQKTIEILERIKLSLNRQKKTIVVCYGDELADINFKNLNGTKTRIELLPNGKIEPYKKELWKADTIRLFSKTKTNRPTVLVSQGGLARAQNFWTRRSVVQILIFLGNLKKTSTADFITKNVKNNSSAEFIEKNLKTISTVDFIEKQNFHC